MTGYTIYYQQVGENRSSVCAGANETSATISGLSQNATFFITIVATSSVFPSNMSDPQTVTVGQS